MTVVEALTLKFDSISTEAENILERVQLIGTTLVLDITRKSDVEMGRRLETLTDLARRAGAVGDIVLEAEVMEIWRGLARATGGKLAISTKKYFTDPLLMEDWNINATRHIKTFRRRVRISEYCSWLGLPLTMSTARSIAIRRFTRLSEQRLDKLSEALSTEETRTER